MLEGILERGSDRGRRQRQGEAGRGRKRQEARAGKDYAKSGHWNDGARSRREESDSETR